MDTLLSTKTKRGRSAKEIKQSGATYTPRLLADFVASQITSVLDNPAKKRRLKILDPATGDGELLLALLEQLKLLNIFDVDVYGFDTDLDALETSELRIKECFPKSEVFLSNNSFLDFVLTEVRPHDNNSLFENKKSPSFDLIIANPPYVRTQVMGAKQAQLLAKQFDLTGRVDLYFAFIIGMSMVLDKNGICGVIVSNRFMTTKAGKTVRESIRNEFDIKRVWDLGDTKLFEAAVLPAVLLLGKDKKSDNSSADFVSIYASSTVEENSLKKDVIEALSCEGGVALKDGRKFTVNRGTLDLTTESDSVWRISNEFSNEWLSKVDKNTFLTFGEIGKIRVGVKTCADTVFIRDDWRSMPKDTIPELLRKLTTHHIGGQFRSLETNLPKEIIYPHEIGDNGKRKASDLSSYPKTKAYLDQYKQQLESRKYVIDGGRQWYEIWVPQDPDSWHQPKLVFRDIAEKPTFWLDFEGSVVNGDCYWMKLSNNSDTDLLWLAASVANSTFIESFYDHSFNNKLYAGRRRYITQYVENFPLPDPSLKTSKSIIASAKAIYECTDSKKKEALLKKNDRMVWKALGVGVKEIAR